MAHQEYRPVASDWHQEYPDWHNVGQRTWLTKDFDKPLPDDDLNSLFHDGVTFTKKLGAGGFGEVWIARIARFKQDRQGKWLSGTFACKIVGLKGQYPVAGLRMAVYNMLKEFKVLKEIKHPHIVNMEHVIRLYDETHPFPHPYYVLYFMDLMHESLIDLVKAMGRMTEVVVNEMFMQMIQALHYLHAQAYVAHLDIKPANILVRHQTENKFHVTYKLADFGLAINFNPGGPYVISLQEYGGTPMYMSPEMRAKAPQVDTFKCDIYSLAVTLIECLTGVTRTVPPNCLRVIDAIQRRLNITHITQDLQDLIRGMTARNPGKRPTTAEILTHRWTQKVPYNPGGYVTIQ